MKFYKKKHSLRSSSRASVEKSVQKKMCKFTEKEL